MRALAVALVLYGCQTLAQADDGRPFAAEWRVDGVTLLKEGSGARLTWKAARYRLKFPDRDSVEWGEEDDIRLEAWVKISCQVPRFLVAARPLAAELELPNNPDIERKREAALERARAEGKSVWDLLNVVLEERESPVRVHLGESAQFSSLLEQGGGTRAVVKPLKPALVLSALVSGVEVDMSVEGEQMHVQLRFKPDGELARVGRLMVRYCMGRPVDAFEIESRERTSAEVIDPSELIGLGAETGQQRTRDGVWWGPILSEGELQGGESTVYSVGSTVTGPRLLRRIDASYSKEARSAGLEGSVVLGIEVWEDGRAHNIRVLRSVGMGLDEKAIEAVSQWEFSPGRVNGQPVSFRVQAQFDFRLLGKQ